MNYTDENDARYIDLKSYSIRIAKKVSEGLYYISIRNKSNYFNVVVNYIKASDIKDAENQAFELLKDYLVSLRDEIDSTLAEISNRTEG